MSLGEIIPLVIFAAVSGAIVGYAVAFLIQCIRQKNGG